MTTFSDWLVNELRIRDMSPADLARAMKKDQGVVSRLLRNERKPTPDTLNAIARALKLPPETVLAAAGLYKPTYKPDEDRDPTLLEWIKLFKDADEHEREEMINYARYMASRALQRRTGEK